MINGFYSIYYTGLSGSGFGLVILNDGVIIGIDYAGGMYDGIFSRDESERLLRGNITIKIPEEASFIIGISPEHQLSELSLPLELPFSFANGEPITIRTTLGPVNVIFKKLRDLAKDESNE